MPFDSTFTNPGTFGTAVPPIAAAAATYLRVRRPRRRRPRSAQDADFGDAVLSLSTAPHEPDICMNALSLQDDDDNGRRTDAATIPMKEGAGHNTAAPRAAVWRKWQGRSVGATKATNAVRVIDVVMAQHEIPDDDDDEPLSAPRRPHKRRRLTLVGESTNQTLQGLLHDAGMLHTKKKQPLKILHPLERLVDDSLLQTFAGHCRPGEHVHFVRRDERLRPSGRRGHTSWLHWCNAEHGNVLHACAFWNDGETARALLLQDDERDQLVHGLNSDGQTPYEVAQYCGYADMCALMEGLGADMTSCVYDVYVLDESHDGREQNSGIDTMPPVTFELTGGHAYWNEHGEYVVEPTTLANNGDNDESVSDDDDADSNDEGWYGNDYPEEEDDDDSDSSPDVRRMNPSANPEPVWAGGPQCGENVDIIGDKDGLLKSELQSYCHHYPAVVPGRSQRLSGSSDLDGGRYDPAYGMINGADNDSEYDEYI